MLVCKGTPPIAEILCVKNGRVIVVCGFLMKWLKKYILKVWKKSWEPFGSCLLNSTANPAKLGWKWAGLAVLFSKQLPQFFFKLSAYLFKMISLRTHNISTIVGVKAKGFPYFEVHCMQIGFLCPRLMMQEILLLLCCWRAWVRWGNILSMYVSN